MSLLDKLGDKTIKDALGGITVKELMDEAAILYSDFWAKVVIQSDAWQKTFTGAVDALTKESAAWRRAINIQIGGK